jgi:hypothetical protein
MILLIRECSVCSHDIDAGSNTMASNCGLLVKQAIMLLDNFDPRKQCLDYFIEDATNAMEVLYLFVRVRVRARVCVCVCV